MTGAADYEGGGLSRETNWWGAFVIGLAGTILVTGIAPVMVTALGAAAIPIIVLITISGYLLCLLLAELSAMMPERTGGSPAYAYVAYKDKWPRFAKHVNGFTGVGLLARLVPRGAAQHDPRVLLHRVALRARSHERRHADPHLHRLLDDCHRNCRDPARLHPGVARDPARRALRDGARAAGDGPAHVPRDRPRLRPVEDQLGRAVGVQPDRRHRVLHEPLRSQLAHDLHRLRLPAHLERDRDGGRRLLHRRVP